MRFPNLVFCVVLTVLNLLYSCSKNVTEDSFEIVKSEISAKQENSKSSAYLTKNVIILVVDGPRFSETWGDLGHVHIPVVSKELSAKGVVNTQFFNQGPTYTISGHTAITTGNYQTIDNSGRETPQFPSIFQHWSEASEDKNPQSWLITSKDKLEVLSDCLSDDWKGSFKPLTDCGKSGLGSGYRSDKVTFERTLYIMKKHHPKLVLINLKDPDYYAHQNKWEEYLQAIKQSDEYTGKLWRFLENDPVYKGSTTLFVTNDHGRHDNDILNGFISHGDGCATCRHINLLAIGPDFKKNTIVDFKRNQIDIPATISELMKFKMPYGKGKVMRELFK